MGYVSCGSDLGRTTPCPRCDPDSSPDTERRNSPTQDLIECLKDAIFRLADWIGSDCECDSSHTAVGTQCCLCEYRAVIRRAEGEANELS